MIALNAFEVILLITIHHSSNLMNMKVPICVIFLSKELFEKVAKYTLSNGSSSKAVLIQL